MHLAKGAKGKGQEVGTGLGCDQVRGGLSVTSVIRWVTGAGELRRAREGGLP